MKKIFQADLLSYWLSYGKDSLKKVKTQIGTMKKHGCAGLWLIRLWDSDPSDLGFSIIDYAVNPMFGTEKDLEDLINAAHKNGMSVGCDVVPNHASRWNPLVRGHDSIYTASSQIAEHAIDEGIPSFFGDNAYTRIQTHRGAVWARTKFSDTQIDLNWEKSIVGDYFRTIFHKIKMMNFDFVRVDCSTILLEDVSKANPQNMLACYDAEKSVRAILEVADGMPLFLECFNPKEIVNCDFGDNVYVVDCSFVMDGGTYHWADFKKNALKYSGYPKYVPLLGGHDQMPFRNRFNRPFNDNMVKEFRDFEYMFTDLATEIGYKHPGGEPTAFELAFEADPSNQNKRWMARAPIEEIIRIGTLNEWAAERKTTS